jgi:aspartokinase
MSDTQTANLSFERERGVYALQVMRDVAHAVISVGDDSQRVSRIVQVLRLLAGADIPVFLVKLHRTAITLAFAGVDIPKTESALTEAGFRATIRRDLVVVSVRAASMRDLSGIMVEIADTLSNIGARFYETGDSHNSVQCLIEEARVPEAQAALCRSFHLDARAMRESSLQAGGAV